MASPTVSVENNSKRIRCVALDQCNLIVAGKFRRESRPLICPPVLCRVDNLALASPRCGSALVKTVRVIHVPRIIAGRAEERTGGPFEKQAVSLKLIHQSLPAIDRQQCYREIRSRRSVRRLRRPRRSLGNGNRYCKPPLLCPRAIDHPPCRGFALASYTCGCAATPNVRLEGRPVRW